MKNNLLRGAFLLFLFSITYISKAQNNNHINRGVPPVANNSNGSNNQQKSKYAVFDFELMVQAMPGYKAVDSLVQAFEADTLTPEHDFYVSEFKRIDSSYRVDSLAGKPKSITDLLLQQRNQLYINLYYWQQIAQNRSDNKRAQLAQPLFEQIATVYQQILKNRHYDLILKPSAVEFGSNVDNLFVVVAQALHVQLPAQLGGNTDNNN